MKNIIITAIISLFVSIVHAQAPMIINGTTTDEFYQEVVLFEVVNGRTEPIAQSKVVNGKFAFKFFPTYEGFYVLGSTQTQNNSARHIIYGKENEVLNIAIGGKSYQLSGKNSADNKDLERFQSMLDDMKEGIRLGGPITYVEFYPIVEKLEPQIAPFKTTSKNKTFLSNFEILRHYLFHYYALHFQYLPKRAHPDAEEIISFYKELDHQKLLNENLLILPFGDSFLMNLVIDAGQQKKYSIKQGENKAQNAIDFIPDTTIKGQYIVLLSNNFKSYDDYLRLVEPNRNYLTLADQEKRLNAKLVKLADSKPGDDFIDFTFPDIAGKQHSKKSLKGNIIVIDFWATWCGPCKQEEPFYEKLADNYRNKNVKFLAISTDKDKAAWEKYVSAKESDLNITHLHASNKNILSDAYQINTIPRYMVIDANGKIVTTNSPRPSNVELKNLIDKLIKQ
ncbi:TlpA disulfide reductase family protein [Sphingobacterium sp.]|uniref:TlpA family protein disulfide reductase n=1 Tax=Sphingobacterium sp. TaxID=341027 RepID=UPI00289CD066|nr:TlpA disulfide reductase family protein [Sphingobacterium sp.]